MSEKFVIKEASVTWSAVRSSGPGGQNVNKVATAVQLRFSLSESGLPANAVERFRTLFAAKLVDGNVLLIKAQTERTQQANLRAARSRLEVMISAALVKPKHRIATRPGKGARERRLKAKARHAKIKAARRAKPGDF